ncbi:hypothetical protein [Bacillus atrophaeus]|uniref:hypothetical protein n=1 Tax=Bacillus atrophaeus TaxID=1452 RepID=UPI00228252EB|nr:hypothetical protein [Bacillus atrophaeus]MCY8514703.1 hypothetical protein [Bacillus atrophaeus]MCY8990784.1 hypothetical protein [Bacillus atrophaeus]MCY9158847.1 hypothetical protein [Bacillus atrophaeus]
MQNMIIPEEVSIKNIIKKKSLSPNNFKEINIKRKSQTKVSHYLNEEIPYFKGDEPGSLTYVENSKVKFLRNSCINALNTSFLPKKLISLNPNYGFENMVDNLDVLLCKDANIGDACLYIDNREDAEEVTVYSSGIVKPNFKEERYKYYCLAFFKDSYFLQQLDAKTPRGSTIRHAGDRFRDCQIPLLKENEEWVYPIFENLLKNVAYAEVVSFNKLKQSEEIIDKELMTNEIDFKNPSISKVFKEERVDAGIYSKSVQGLFKNIELYKHGYSDIETYGYSLKRGPNLAQRDLGRSLKTEEYRPNYNLLVYPSDISDNGYLLKSVYLGARNKVWYLENKDILFSAEGSVGKTFVICDEEMKFTTNFHGMIIYPTKRDETDISKSVFIGLFLNYMRAKGIIDKLSVGGNGGSFAVGYWDTILIPNFPSSIVEELSKIYNFDSQLNPFEFDINKIKAAGIFQLNNFRILCNDFLKMIIDDIKIDKLKDLNYYKAKH